MSFRLFSRIFRRAKAPAPVRADLAPLFHAARVERANAPTRPELLCQKRATTARLPVIG